VWFSVDMPGLTAREYLRVSADKSGRGASVAQQHADNERAASRAAWLLLAPYSEPEAVSASRYSRKAREAFGQLLEDIDSGAFAANVLIMWEASRGSRRTGEWVDLVDVCAAHGVRIHVTSHQRTYEPTNARDRRTLLEDAVDSEYESAKLSARVARALAANAAAGRPHGHIPYGFRRVYDDRTGALIRQEADPQTAPNVAELFTRVRAGDSLRSIERDWSARGIVNKSARPFGAAHLRSLLDVRAYVGDRVHGDAVYPGDWEPLVSRDVWQAVRSILSAPGRRTNRPGRGKYAVSMLARCGVCEGPMIGDAKVDGKHRTVPVYKCRNTHVMVSMPALDEYVRQTVVGFLVDPALRDRLTAASSDGDQLRTARDAVAKIRGELNDLYERGAGGGISPAGVAAVEPGILARLRSAQSALDGLQTPSVLAGLLDGASDVDEALTETTPERLRSIYAVVFAPGLLGVPHVMRSARKGPRQPPVDDRVDWRRLSRSA